MHYGAIKMTDVANGPGVRVTLFVSGCPHHCEGCFQPETWNYRYGEPFTREVEDRILEGLAPDFITGLTLLGGEPMEPSNQEGLIGLLRRVHERYPHKSIWCFTGYDFERDILGDMCHRLPYTREILGYLDVLVDGPFEIDKKQWNLKFKGSWNQRSIKVQESLDQKKIVLWDA